MIFREIQKLLSIAAVFVMFSGVLAGCEDRPTQTVSAADQEKSVERAIPSSPENQVKGTIMMYNRLLTDGYATMNMNGLAQVADIGAAKKAYHHMVALGEGGVKLLSTLKDIRFEEVSFPEASSATVKTRELWDFSQINIKDASVALEEKDFAYQLDYRLEKRDGRWLVTSVTAAAERAEQKLPKAQQDNL